MTQYWQYHLLATEPFVFEITVIHAQCLAHLFYILQHMSEKM